MQRNLMIKTGVIVATILACIFGVIGFPTSLKQAEANAGQRIHLGLDLSGGTYLMRNLDCAVINTVHLLREETGEEPYQTVYGVFEEGGQLYKNAGFRKKTHVQVAVIDPACILGYFRS